MDSIFPSYTFSKLRNQALVAPAVRTPPVVVAVRTCLAVGPAAPPVHADQARVGRVASAFPSRHLNLLPRSTHITNPLSIQGSARTCGCKRPPAALRSWARMEGAGSQQYRRCGGRASRCRPHPPFACCSPGRGRRIADAERLHEDLETESRSTYRPKGI